MVSYILHYASVTRRYWFQVPDLWIFFHKHHLFLGVNHCYRWRNIEKHVARCKKKKQDYGKASHLYHFSGVFFISLGTGSLPEGHGPQVFYKGCHAESAGSPQCLVRRLYGKTSILMGTIPLYTIMIMIYQILYLDPFWWLLRGSRYRNIWR